MGMCFTTAPTTEFGSGRTQNTYEIACDTSLQQVTAILQQHDADCHVAVNGYNYIINTPRTLTREHLWELFAAHAIVPSYFRDISTSTRKLFTEQSHD